jgi:uncharacterized protein YdaU (DUF1376 family)
MVAFYKHNIADWHDGTCALSDSEYRVYHVVCMLIYQNEGPVTHHERGLAGTCNMHWRKFRCALSGLIEKGLITELDGRLSNARALRELSYLAQDRFNGASGGRHKAANALKNKDADPSIRLDKTRLEKTKQGATHYAWARKVIKLDQKDYQEWKRIFPHLDLDAELMARDTWLETQPPNVQKQWMMTTSALLNKRNTHARISSQQQGYGQQMRRNVDEKGRDIQYVGGIRLDYVT